MDGAFTLRRLAEPDLARKRTAQPHRLSLFLQRDFSDEALRQPVEPSFGQAELEAQRRDGYDAGRTEGYAEGLADAAASRDAHRAAVELQSLGIIAAAIADGSGKAAAVADRSAEALAKALIASMRAVMPALIARSAPGEVAAMLAQVLPGLSREPAVRIEVAPELADFVAGTVAGLAPEHRHKISVTGLPDMTQGEARVRWESGSALRDPAQVWDAVMKTLQPLSAEAGERESENGN